MDGTNAAGRKVSLLNDNGPPPLVRLPSISPSLRSRTSSYAPSPIGSPPVPQLVRSISSDSNMQTPSPITPDFNFDSLSQSMDSPVFAHQNGFFQSHTKDHPSAYPPVPHPAGALPYHAANPAQPAYFAQQSLQDQAPGAPQASSAQGPPGARPKKNSYPCPMAKQYNCHDFFTTSGHAARHAKKHTGKKDAFCPECNKAFTRKDNMEQHRRTHQSGRNAAKATDSGVKKIKTQAKRPKPAPLQSSTPTMSMSMVDPSLPISPASSFMAAPAVQPTDVFSDFVHQQRSPYPDPTAYSMTHSYNAASSYGGLDALAIAASGEKRKFES